MNRKELIRELKEKGIEKVYGRSLSKCYKDELESYLETISQGEKEESVKKYLSFTQINMLMRCGLQYYYRYFRGIILPPKAAMTMGRSVGAGIDHAYITKLGLHLAPLSEVEDVYNEEFLSLVEETDWEDEKPNDVMDRGRRLLRKYYNTTVPRFEPAEVQKEFSHYLEEFDIKIIGYPDLIDARGFIIDHKCRSRKVDTIKQDLQLSLYAYLYRMVYHSEEEGVSYHNLISYKDREEIDIETDKRSIEAIMRILRIIDFCIRTIKARAFLPATPDSWWCSEKWCGYWHLCHQEI